MWMNEVMYKIFEMSIMASVAILLVLLVRVLFRKLPKIYSYVLWGIVLFRLLCPISVSSPFSVFQVFLLTEETIGYYEMPIAGQYNVSDGVTDYSEISNVEMVDRGIANTELSNAEIDNVQLGNEDIIRTEADFRRTIKKSVPVLWCLGAAFVLTYSVISLLCLKKKLIGAVKLRDNIYLCDYIGTPFVIGVFKPGIYLPSSIGEEEKEYIILHEQIHIKRCDHIFRLLAFIALAIHWFNPLVWLAYRQSGVDMEMSCDEAVIKKVGADIRTAYSTSLLSFSTGRRHINGMLLAFGESNVKNRIENIMKLKKTTVIAGAVAVLMVAVVAIIAGSNPDTKTAGESNVQELSATTDLAENTDANSMDISNEDVSASDTDVQEEQTEENALLNEESRREQIEQWAKAFCNRDGKIIVSMVTEDVLTTMEEAGIYHGDYAFGWSSPWPYDDVKDYQIIEMTDSSATILYYAWVLSDPHVWVWRETLQFHEDNGKVVIDAEELKEMDYIVTGEEFKKAYPNGIAGTPMDYLTASIEDSDITTGELLNQYALEEQKVYLRLLSPDNAAVFFLNLLDNPNKVRVNSGMPHNDGSVSVLINFEETGEKLAVTMIQPYGENGIWLIQEFDLQEDSIE